MKSELSFSYFMEPIFKNDTVTRKTLIKQKLRILGIAVVPNWIYFTVLDDEGEKYQVNNRLSSEFRKKYNRYGE